ncbi:MAG: hypothetical protein JNK48_24785 [Bryobacterales bacterium]|nr:hypothetical protein [Bryobacterales bacterium]
MSSPLTFPTFSTALLSGESREELEALLEAYFTEYHPRTVTEERAISEMVDAEWRLRRLRKSQFHTTDLSAREFRKFEAHLIRLYDRALHNLLQRKGAMAGDERRGVPSTLTAEQSTLDMHSAPN